GFGLALFLTPLFRICIFTCASADKVHGLTLLHVVRALFSGLGASAYATMWQRRQVFYHDRLGSQLTAFNPPTQAFFAEAPGFQLTGLSADAQLEFFLQQQATSLALDDCFYFMGWMLVGLLLSFAVTIFFKRGSFSTRLIKA